jgi:hypothetical protein
MRTIAWILLAATLAIGSGCATPPDWIERTLVTVDVTGTWYGASPLQVGTTYPTLWLELRQVGPKAQGSARAYLGLSPTLSGPIEGTITGDVFTFRQTNGTLKGELTFSGDEMKGEILEPRRVPIVLRRIESPARPDSRRQ